jgi:hypothetical protein
MKLIQLLANTNYIIVNKTLANKLGIKCSIILGELCGEYEYWANKNELVDDEYFFSTMENIEHNTTIPRSTQNSCIDKLKKLGIIETKVMGLPAKRYFKIHQEKLYEILNS